MAGELKPLALPEDTGEACQQPCQVVTWQSAQHCL